MSKIVKVNDSNYRLVVQSGGTITLDSGVNVGGVLITGNLTVLGTTTTIDTAQMTIEDNIILLNKGEQGALITKGTSGIEIDRGSSPNALMIFDENVDHFDQIADDDISGTFVLRTENGATSGLQVGTILIDKNRPADLIFDLQNTIRTLKIENSQGDTYEELLFPISDTTKDDYIPNRKFITDYVEAGTVTPGMADVDKIYKTVSGVEKTRVQTYATDIEFLVNSLLRAKIDQYGLFVDDIKIAGQTISNTTSSNLVLTASNNYVEVDAILSLDDLAPGPTPGAVGGTTKIYALASAGPGKTGLFFSNVTTADELVAKNRALLFSMLF